LPLTLESLFHSPKSQSKAKITLSFLILAL
jgi:hypothetical protein